MNRGDRYTLWGFSGVITMSGGGLALVRWMATGRIMLLAIGVLASLAGLAIILRTAFLATEPEETQ
jgi:hypothetical protein